MCILARVKNLTEGEAFRAFFNFPTRAIEHIMYLVYPATIYPIIRIKRALFDNFCCISTFETMIETINVGLMHDAILRVSLYKVCFTGDLYSVCKG